MKRTIYLIYLLSLLLAPALCAQTDVVRAFPLSDVRLLESPFLHAQALDRQYQLALEADRLLAPFLREAGLAPKAESYTNWENTGLDGHIGGHYLSALALMYASTGDAAVKERLDYMLAELRRCQTANGDGYIGGVPGGKAIWEAIARGDIKAEPFGLNGKWVPLYNIHKTYAGLRDAWIYAQSAEAKEMLIAMADWMLHLTEGLTDEQMQDMLRSEHGGLNETFADVAAITGEAKYLALAHRFSHRFILDPLLDGEDKLTGLHANTQIPKVIGFKRIADLEGNAGWSEAARFFWETVVDHRSVCIGGNSTGEHFNPTDNFSRMIRSIEGPETCNTYNMLRLSKMLFETSADKHYVDYYERALYNHILSTQHPETGGLVYFTQMRPGHYRVYSQPQTSFWCCVGSGIENHAKYGEMIYASAGDALYVNLFIPSRLDWKEKQTEVVQQNNFPDEARTQLTINPAAPTAFDLRIRYPQWVADGALALTLNGQPIAADKISDGYASIRRTWKKGDVVSVSLPMQLRTEQLPDHSSYYAFAYGPLILAAKAGTEDMDGLFADDSRGGHIAHGHQVPLKDQPIVVSEAGRLTSLVTPKATPLTFRLTGLYPADKQAEAELIPFYRLHESRYIIYWPQATEDGVVEMRKQIEEQEKNRLALERLTVDQVTCGEQQPESDHAVRSERSTIGFSEDIHWREARGWFSYQLKNKGHAARLLHVSYFDSDPNRTFDVYIDDRKAQTVRLAGDKNETIQSIAIPLTETEQAMDVLTIRFQAADRSATGKVTAVRLISGEIVYL